MLGRHREELIGASLLSLYTKESEATSRGAVERVLAGEPVENVELDVVTASGVRSFSLHATPVRDEKGNVTGARSSLRDINDLRAAKQLADARFVELERSNAELQEFAYAVSHDLKAPLRGIRSISRMLKADLSAEAQTEGVREMLQLLDSRGGAHAAFAHRDVDVRSGWAKRRNSRCYDSGATRS